MKITPSWVATFETNTQTLIQSAWERMKPNLIWQKFMDVKKSETGQELFFYLLETAKIADEQQGGNKRFDDIAATFFTIVNKNSGAGLRLTKNEIEDNMMAGANMRGMPALDYAASWARQMGGHAAYWPQDLMFQLLALGKTTPAYDGVNFFSTAHLINPSNAAAGTYSNYFSGGTAKPIDTTNAATLDTAAVNLASVIATIRQYTQANGKPRNLVPKFVMAGPANQKRLFEILNGKQLITGGANAFGAIENQIATYGIEPIIANEMGADLGYYVAMEMLPGEGGSLIFQDRDPYVLSSYQPESQAELQRRKDFEWSFDGRNAAAFGHPYLLVRVDAT